VIVGVGQLRSNRDKTLAGAREPLDLIVEALTRAAEDSGVGTSLLSSIDALSVVNVNSWHYADLPAMIASAVDAHPAHAEHSTSGGNQPVKLLDEAAARIARGTSRVAAICGGEAMASLSAFASAGCTPRWSTEPGGRKTVPESEFATERMIRYGLTYPVRSYPLYENGLRAHLGQDFATAQASSGQIYSEFSRVATGNPAAWDQVERTADEITTVTERNRYICYPYPLLMNAQPKVDQAAALIVTSLGVARAMGIADDKLVYVWGGAGAADCADIYERVDYTHSPAMDAVFASTLKAAGLASEELDLVDLYSCFPIVPKLASISLGLPESTPLSVTGGLNSFGGPASNYSTHGLVASVQRLRERGGRGLVYGNGELLTKHHAVLLSDAPHVAGYIGVAVREEDYAADGPTVLDSYSGPGVIETFTVEFARDGQPVRAWIIGRTPNRDRFPAWSVDPAQLAALVDPRREPIGRAGTAALSESGLIIFEFDSAGATSLREEES
jgi:acetyl-CoA C-acetyltransferase